MVFESLPDVVEEKQSSVSIIVATTLAGSQSQIPNILLSKLVSHQEDMTSLSRPFQWMRLCIQNPLIQIHQRWLAENQIEILQRLGQPEALHAVALLRS